MNKGPNKIHNREALMIHNFMPQPYPLWLVTEDTNGRLAPGIGLVIGWTPAGGGRLVAVVADGATAGPATETDDRHHTLFADEQEAAEHHRALCR